VQLCNAQTHMTLVCAAPFDDGIPFRTTGRTCELEITTNYRQVFGDLVETLAGRTGIESMGKLMAFCLTHRTAERSANYFKPTPGNAVHAINRLVLFAKEHPGGIWRVT
jgi:hypothetical protein